MESRVAFTSIALLAFNLGAAELSAQRPGRDAVRRGFRAVDRIQAGDIAPDFTLTKLAGGTTITLSDFRGKKPVALVFGSYT